MPIFRLDKLVRDKTPELNKNNWDIETRTKQLKGEAKLNALFDKLAEEFSELKNAKAEDQAKEIGDIRDVVDAIVGELHVSEER
ncbi:MAG: hypothetical protein AAB834_05425 [Patescibacteria group bacterium]